MAKLPLICLAILSFSSSALGISHNIRHVTFPRHQLSHPTIPPAKFSVPISGGTPIRRSKRDLLRTLRSKSAKAKGPGGSSGSSRAPGSGNAAVIDGTDYGEEFMINATIGGLTYQLIIDTGSSDTWLVQKGFQCINLASEPQPESDCSFGPVYDPKASKTYKSIPNVNFNITYGDGEFLLGTAGNETVSIGGLTVSHQEIGVVSRAAWFGDGFTSGLVGLAYPDLTSVFTGTNASNDVFLGNMAIYPPFPFRAFETGRMKNPFFSVALGRATFEEEQNEPTESGLGYISFGGMPPVSVTKTSTTAPVQGYQMQSFTPSNSSHSVYFFYTIDVQDFTFNGAPSHKPVFSSNVILDTGTTLNYVPTEIADAFAAAVKPPASFSDDLGAYQVDCKAEVPELQVRIHGTTFAIDPRDNIMGLGTDDDGNDLCILGTNDGGENDDNNLFVLGDTFLHNVVVTFNVQNNEITITQRQKY